MAQGPYLEVVDINYVNGQLEGTITLYNAPEKRQLFISWRGKDFKHTVTRIDGAAPAVAYVTPLQSRSATGEPVTKDPAVETRPLAKAGRWSTWLQLKAPTLLVMPSSIPLIDADITPRGVWKVDNRLCAIWPASEQERYIGFKLGDSEEDLSKCEQRWQKRTSGKAASQLTDWITSAIAAAAVIVTALILYIVIGGQDLGTVATIGAGVIAVIGGLNVVLRMILHARVLRISAGD